jgi:hypothetical protein
MAVMQPAASSLLCMMPVETNTKMLENIGNTIASNSEILARGNGSTFRRSSGHEQNHSDLREFVRLIIIFVIFIGVVIVIY